MGAEDRRVRDAGVSSDQSEEDAISESVAIQTDETGWIRVGPNWVDATRIVAVVYSGTGPTSAESSVVVEIGDDFATYSESVSPDEIMERIVYATTNEDDDEDGDDEK